ncbi:MAG: cellulase family glycosylhydrolase [Proteobacteria bacterium]|nr:cellulase family glycosylhydrolase [Pseudomonadota bacterium]
MRVALIALLIAACGDNRAAPCGGRVCGGQLRDDDGRAVILRGVNLANAHKVAPYTDTFEPADYARLRTWGFTSIRYVIPWAAIEPTRGVYDDAYLDLVATRLGWARDAGLAVIVDMHQDVFGEGFGFDGAPRWACDEARYAAFVPRTPWPLSYTDPNVIACFDHLWSDDALQAAFAAMWRHVAQRLADQPAVIGFDPLNEPHWGSHGIATFERDLLQPFYARVIDEVHAAAPHWVAFVEPASSRNLGFATSLTPFPGVDVVYAPHLYDPSAETSGMFDSGHRADLVTNTGEYRLEADTLGAALWIGEYGGQGTDPNIAAYLDAVHDGAAAALAGTTYWSYDKGGGYDLLHADGSEVTPLVDAIVRPYPARVAGDPVAWDYDDAARTLRVSWLPNAAITAPTVIIAPARVYPTPPQVACDGCTVERVGDELRVTTARSDVVTATVSP